MLLLRGAATCKIYDQKCVEALANLLTKTFDELHKVSTPCLDDHQRKPEDLESVGELSETCSKNCIGMFVPCSGATRFMMDSDLSGTISPKIEQSMRQETSEIDQQHAPHDRLQAVDGKLGLNQDADVGGNLTDFKCTSGGVLCIFGCHTRVPVFFWYVSSRLQSLAAILKQKVYHWTQVYAWKAHQH